jgi:hypothetical protein
MALLFEAEAPTEPLGPVTSCDHFGWGVDFDFSGCHSDLKLVSEDIWALMRENCGDSRIEVSGVAGANKDFERGESKRNVICVFKCCTNLSRGKHFR